MTIGSQNIESPNCYRFLNVSGQVGDSLRKIDWSNTLLGPIPEWPSSLRIAAGAMLRSSAPMALLWGAQGFFLYNDALLEAFLPFFEGKHPHALGHKVTTIWPEIGLWLQNVVDTVLDGKSLTFTNQLFAMRQGETTLKLMKDLNFSPVLDEDGLPVGVLVVASDSREHALVEGPRAEAEEYLELAMDADGLVGTWDWHIQTDVVYADPRFAIMFSLPPEKGSEGVPLQSYVNGIHPDDVPAVQEAIQQTVATRGKYSIEYRLLKADGEIRWIMARGQCFSDREGNPWRFLGIAVDITEQKKAAAAIEDKAQLLNTITDNASVALFVMDAEGRVTFMNPAAEQITGYSAEELTGRVLHDVIHYKHLDGSHFPIQDCLIGATVLFKATRLKNHEDVFIHKDGHFYPVLCASSPIIKQGEVTAIVLEVLDMTERRQSEQSLRESEDRFRNLADTAPMYMAMADETGNAVYFNKPWLEFTGKSLDEMKGIGWLCTLHPDDAPKFEADFRHAFEHQVPINKHYRFRRADGEYRWMFAVGAPRFTTDGRFVGYFGTYTDFHELKQAQDALLESEERFRTLADNMPNLAWMAHADGMIFWYNNRWYEYTGTTFEQMQGMGWQAVHDPALLPEVMERWYHSLGTGATFEMVFPIRGADGVFRPFLTRMRPVKDEQGQVIRWLGTNTDISRQRETEAALKASESRLRSYIHQQDAIAKFSLQAMSGMDDLAEITRLGVQMVAETLNTQFSKVLQKVNGDPFCMRFMAAYGFKADMVGRIMTADMEPHAAYVLARQEPTVTENIHEETRFRPSQVHFDYNLVSGIAVIIYAKGTPFGILQVDFTEARQFNDAEINFMQTAATLIGTVIERKQNEEALTHQHDLVQEYARRLETSNKDLSQFASIVSHDLQAPLRKLVVFGDYLKKTEADTLSDQGRDYIARMQRSTHRMQALITDLLTLSRVDRQDAPFRRIQFSDVHSTVLEDLAMPIRETKASIELTGSCEFDADWAQMVQMMTNLVDNAIKYRHPERIPHIVISCQPKQAEWVEITVSDNGIGIKPEHYDKIFEIFQRLHNDAQYSGTGIGLAIVKRIVNRHRGSISVDSVPGTGTRFSIVLPQQQSN